MIFEPSTLPGAYTISLEPFADDRGWFSRYFCKREFESIGHTDEFVQFNHSFNAVKGTIRGMHYQHPPHTEVKLIRCVSGAVYDVIVDIRQNSPTFMQWFGVKLSEENKKMIYVPAGFAHGFQTLTDGAQLLYHHTEFYVPGHEGAIRYNDALLNIEWPLEATVISDKDNNYADLTNEFKGVAV